MADVGQRTISEFSHEELNEVQRITQRDVGVILGRVGVAD